MTKAEQTRQLIITKSAELFNKYGYDGCSMSDIMEATQLKKGGIYNHFKGKDEIAMEAFDYAAEKVFHRFRVALAEQHKMLDKVITCIEVYASFGKDPVVSGGCPIFNTAIDAHHNHPELREKARNAMLTMKKYLEIKLNEGQAAGEFVCTQPPEDIATMIYITLEGAIIYARVAKSYHSIDLAVKNLKDFLDQNIHQT